MSLKIISTEINTQASPKIRTCGTIGERERKTL